LRRLGCSLVEHNDSLGSSEPVGEWIVWHAVGCLRHQAPAPGSPAGVGVDTAGWFLDV